jgi:hypothetical protein
MGNARTWIFRILVLLGAGLLAYTWFQPWWTAYIVALETTAINIYPWGLESFVPAQYAAWIAGYDKAMPGWFTPFMWVYFGLCMAALLFSLFASSNKSIGIGKFKVSLPTAIVGGVGLSFIIVVISAVLVISAKIKGFYNAPLIGSIWLTMEEGKESAVDTSLLTAYYLACATGPILLILAITRRFIVGKKKKPSHQR